MKQKSISKYILGIESSCDETAASVLVFDEKNFKILSSVIASQDKIHTKTGGVVPEVAAREHLVNIIPVIDTALKKAKISLDQINLIAVTSGPGLITSLMVGVDTAKAIGSALGIPVMPINHVEAHVYSPFINSPYTPSLLKRGRGEFPAISLVVSGVHTDLVLVKSLTQYKKIGQTLDDAAGEAFDKIARLLGLPYPGGPMLAKLAKKGKANIDFPRPMLSSKDFNFSFSGLKTSVLYYLRDNLLHSPLPLEGGGTKGEGELKANIAASAQQAIVDTLVEKTIRAAKKYQAKTILLGGGVAANALLRKTLKAESYKLKVNFLAAKPQFCTDNAGMIAFLGYLHHTQGKKSKRPIIADPNWEL